MKFVAGVLGNIKNEGDFGQFESSAYKEDNPDYPFHLSVVDEKCDYRNFFSGKNIQDVGIQKTKKLCEEAKKYGGGFGLECVQWSFSSTEDLLVCYEKVCASDFPTEEECYKAEMMLIKQELMGSFSGVYAKWLRDSPSNIEASANWNLL